MARLDNRHATQLPGVHDVQVNGKGRPTLIVPTQTTTISIGIVVDKIMANKVVRSTIPIKSAILIKRYQQKRLQGQDPNILIDFVAHVRGGHLLKQHPRLLHVTL